jgi:hypothetical protein
MIIDLRDLHLYEFIPIQTNIKHSKVKFLSLFLLDKNI